MMHGDSLKLQFEDGPQAWEQLAKPLLPHECDAFVAQAGQHGWVVVSSCPVPLELKQRSGGVIVDALGGVAGGTQPPGTVMGIMLFMKRPLRQLNDEAKAIKESVN